MSLVDSIEVQRANRRFIARSMRAPLLTREREATLARRWRDTADRRALDELVAAYARLVIRHAAAYRRYGLPMGDLIQEGIVGLVVATSRFDPERGVRLATYAGWWIRSAMQEFILRNWSIVRLGTTATQKSLFFNLRRLRARIQRRCPDSLLDSEATATVATELGVKATEVQAMEARLSGLDQSLNATAGDGADEDWQDRLVDPAPTPEEAAVAGIDAAIRGRWLAHALTELSDRERAIVVERRLSDEGATLEAIGRGLGISKERVRQIETRALEKIKRSIVRQSGTGHALFAA